MSEKAGFSHGLGYFAQAFTIDQGRDHCVNGAVVNLCRAISAQYQYGIPRQAFRSAGIGSSAMMMFPQTHAVGVRGSCILYIDERKCFTNTQNTATL